MRYFYVYILTNRTNSTLYVGMTNDLERRISEHRSGKSGFTSRYRLYKLVYYEVFPTAMDAIRREKQIKGGSRRKKTEMIDSMNPQWNDLAPNLR